MPFLCPGTESDRRWPEPGELVTFTAHIVNKGTIASPPTTYEWMIDGSVVMTGTMPSLGAGVEHTTSYDWSWDHMLSADGQRAIGEHTVSFVIDPCNTVAETYENNNVVTDHTTAMSFAIYLSPQAYDALEVPLDPARSYSAEDWVQRQIAAMNQNFAAAVYPVTPDGVPLRVRLNSFGVTPLAPPADGYHDGQWFIADDVRNGYYDPVADVDWGLVHELAHQVSLIDLYNMDTTVNNVHVTDQSGSPSNMAFTWHNVGLMGGGDIAPYTDHNMFSSHSAGAASTYDGYRNGYYGSHLFDIPEQNYLRILDNQGNPASGVQLALFHRAGPWDWVPKMEIDNIADITGETDAAGVFHLPNRSAEGGTTTLNGHVMHDNPFGLVDIVGNKGIFLVRLSRDGHEEFQWLDITQFNLAYWMGDTDSHTYTLTSHLPPEGAPPSPEVTEVQVEGDEVRMCWTAIPSANVSGYRLYRATLPKYEYVLVQDAIPATCTVDTEHVSTYSGKVFAVTAVADSGIESGLSNFVWAPGHDQPSAVTIAADGTRVILDPRNGYALSVQEADGVYREYIGSVHFHLENSQFMEADANGYLIFSHPGDAYTSRHSVRISDADVQPIFEFGEYGTSPGTFRTPTGVARWPATGSAVGTANETPVSSQPSELVQPPSSGTLQASHQPYDPPVEPEDFERILQQPWLQPGSMEFWLQFSGMPHVSDRVYVESVANDGHVLVADSENHRIQAFTASGEFISAFGSQGDGPGQFNRPQGIAVDMANRILVTDRENHRIVRLGFDGTDFTFLDNFDHGFNLPNDVAVDTLGMIYVADTGNHRIVIMDDDGNYLAEIGDVGDGRGLLQTPQGIAIDADRRIAVADTGNRRVVNLEPITASLEVSVTADVAYAVVGETKIEYAYAIANSGDLLLEITALDDRFGPLSFSGDTLAAGSAVTSSLEYQPTAADLPGPLLNTMTVTGSVSSMEAVAQASAEVELRLRAQGQTMCIGDGVTVYVGDSPLAAEQPFDLVAIAGLAPDDLYFGGVRECYPCESYGDVVDATNALVTQGCPNGTSCNTVRRILINADGTYEIATIDTVEPFARIHLPIVRTEGE